MEPVLMKKPINTPPAMNATLIRRRRKAGSVIRRPQPAKPSPGSPPQHNSIPNAVARSTTQLLKKPSPGTPPQHN
ncbi:hypothetical protein QJS04_geneDACA010156 [Acorus gramineus]|uniref:Uncharacterized protein n=1 Tax=Acorus gramineus TaxID=55184 RepID=A0AAV9A6D2_ACOGR|nr:hypothetical protein QJS04_geneDACA010156 [Acorus gramineus]